LSRVLYSAFLLYTFQAYYIMCIVKGSLEGGILKKKVYLRRAHRDDGGRHGSNVREDAFQCISTVVYMQLTFFFRKYVHRHAVT